MLNYIDFEDKQEVKDFILNTLIKKEQLLDEIAVLNRKLKQRKKLKIYGLTFTLRHAKKTHR